MASFCDSGAETPTVCLTCGDKGDTRLLIRCIKCNDSAVHHYCLGFVKPEDDQIPWSCWDCEPRLHKIVPSRKSERISRSIQRSLRVRRNCRKKLYQNSSLAAMISVQTKHEIPETVKQSAYGALPFMGMKSSTDGTEVSKELMNVESRPKPKSGKDPFENIILGEAEVSAIKPDIPEISSPTPRSLKGKTVHDRAQLVGDISLSNGRTKETQSFVENQGNQRVRKQRRKLVLTDESGFDEESVPVNVEVSSLASGQHLGLSNTSHGQMSFQSDDESVPVNVEVSSLASGQHLALSNVSHGQMNFHSDEESVPVNVEVSSLASGQHLDLSIISRGQMSFQPQYDLRALPILDPIWRGQLIVAYKENETAIRIMAHLSNKASLKVIETAISLPSVLVLDILAKDKVFPTPFKSALPTDSNIGLYFFPENERDERVFDCLLEDVIENDLALKIMIKEDVELLIFSSLELPQQHWRFRRKYYLWGVFRQKHHCLAP